MTDDERAELKRLSEKVKHGKRLNVRGRFWRAYRNAANPAAVLDLLERLSDMEAALDNPAVGVHLDAVEQVKALVLSHRQVVAENERLKAALDVLERCAQKALDGIVDHSNEGDLNLASEALDKAREFREDA